MNSSSLIQRRAVAVAKRASKYHWSESTRSPASVLFSSTGRAGNLRRPTSNSLLLDSATTQLPRQPFLPSQFFFTRSFFSLRQQQLSSVNPSLKKNDYSTPKQQVDLSESSINGNDTTIESTSSATIPQRPKKKTFKELGIVNDKIRTSPVLLLNGLHKRKKNKTYYMDRRLLRPKNSTSVRVKAVHAAQTLNVVKVLAKVFGHSTRHLFGKTGVFVQLPKSESHEDDDDLPRFVAVFRFGSVVLFNVAPREAGKILELIKSVGGEKPVASGFERKEHYEVVVFPDLQEPSSVNGDYCLVDKLDMNSVAVIATIMGQTVALDSYSDTVDELLANFANINTSVTNTGNFTEMEKSQLFRVVSQNNSVFIDMVAKLGIKDRSDMAWNLSQYEQVHQGMKDEFEIEDRFENIEFKLDLIQQNAKFFLEILQNQKSNSLEWIIVVLIAFECGLMILEMSGLGPTVFGLVAP